MKRFLATVIALSAITAAFTGCSRNNNNSGSENSGASTSESSAASGSEASSEANSSENSSEVSAVERTAADLGNAAFNCVEWVSMEQLTDDQAVTDYFGIDVSLCDDYYVSMAMMSVHLNEIIVVKPSAGNEDTVRAQLDEHYAYIREGAAFYPAQEKSAAGAVMGHTDDGFYYIIVHEIGSQIADVMNAYQPGEEIPRLELPAESDTSAEEGVSNEVTPE